MTCRVIVDTRALPSRINYSVDYAGNLGSSAAQQTRSGCALILHWLNASKSILGAIAVLALVGYAVFFPHPEHGPREIAQEILPRNARVADMKGSPRDVPEWQELHNQYVQEIKLKASRKEVFSPFPLIPTREQKV